MNRERFVLLCIISLEFFSIYVCNYHRYRRLLSIFPIFPLFSHEIIEKTILFCFTRKRSKYVVLLFCFVIDKYVNFI